MKQIPASKQENLLILIDGSSYLHRAFHALPSLTTSRGEPTGAIYGVLNMINKLIKDYDPTHIAILFDAKGKNFRHELYPAYKATRAKMADDLISQIQPLYDIIEALGLPLISISGVEADDVIGTLAKKATEAGMKVLVVTGDKDLAQIVNSDVTLIDTMTNTTLDISGVKMKFGIPPEKITDYLALVGDTSDNIPGVPNVGPKTAVKWLNTYGSLNDIVTHAKEIEGKVGENLRQSLSQLPLSRELATIKDNLDLDIDPQKISKKSENKEKLIELFRHFEFRNWLALLLQKETATQEKLIGDYETIYKKTELDNWISNLTQLTTFAIGTETSGQNFMTTEIVGLALSDKTKHAAYIPVAHDYPNAHEQLPRDLVLNDLKPILENLHSMKIGHDLKSNLHNLKNHNIEFKGLAFDTMLESYVLNSTLSRHDLETLALKYLGQNSPSLEDIAGKGVKQLPFNKIEIEKASHYAAGNTDITLRLHEVLWPKIEENPKLKKVFQEIEMPLLPVLARMERIGVLINTELLKKQGDELAKRLGEIEKETHNLAGESFNLSSPKQLQEILFIKLKLPILEKTPTGQPSTAESVLQELAINYPLPKLILEHRTLSKLKSTYVDSLPNEINPKTGRVHTSYNQAVTSTGRLSSTNPNLQNIPVRTEEGRRIRQSFIKSPGFKLLSADYSQIELRIMAHLSHDAGLLKAFSQDEDIHRATAAEVFETDIKDVTHEERRRAKAINFGLIYGMSAFGVGRQLNIDRETAQEYMNRYFARYPGVKTYMETIRQTAKTQGYVETIYGRRLYVPDINAQNFQRRSAAERAAINAPMQGSAADIMKLAMIAIDKWIINEKPEVKMLLQVHDELVFEIPVSEIDAASKKIKHLMQDVAELAVPILVHIGIGDNWDEAH
jgi:DNA polymerase I